MKNPDESSRSLRVTNLSVRFSGVASTLFEIAEIDLPPGASLGIRGPSGAGKTTLFHCLAGIETPTAGQVRWGDIDVGALSEAQRDRWRHVSLGLVFQDFHLVDGLDALDNVLLPAWFDRWRATDALRRRAVELLARVGVSAPRRAAASLSRGERQRVAIARALLFSPPAIMADEPTASLDPEHRREITELLLQTTREAGASLLVISHEQELLARLDRCLELRDGALHAI
jgi:putative ABC transport system ATP-binding protein